MTCIVGIVSDGKVFVGGDSAAAEGWEVRPTQLKKVFRLGKLVIGYTSSFRMGQILQYHLNVPPEKKDDKDDLAYMASTFAEAVRSCLKDFGFSKVSENQEEGGTFLVGYKGKLYCVHSDFQVNEMIDGMDAVGCGRQYALGAMRVLEHLPPEERITRALEVAAYFSAAVLSPFVVLEA